jgi:hypothetical protein
LIVSDELFGQLPWYFLIGAAGVAIAWWWLKIKTKLQKGLFSAGIALLLGCAAFVGDVGTRVVIVRFSKLDAPVEKRTGKFIFTLNYVFQNGSKTTLHRLTQSDDATILVNDSPETLRIVGVTYSTQPAFGIGSGKRPPPALIPPMSTSDFPYGAPDEIGPDQTPPATMDSSLPFGVRSWVTWGPVAPEEQ